MVAPAAIVTVAAATVATVVVFELTLKVIPPVGAGLERVRVRFFVSVPLMLRLFGERPMDTACTVRLVEPKPGVEALMATEPALTPVNCGCDAGWVCPAAMVTVAGAIVATFVLALESVTVAPPAGAGTVNAIGKGTDWPVFTERVEGSVIEPNTDTVTLRLPPVMFGDVVLALIVDEPAATAVTCKLTRRSVGIDGNACRHGCNRRIVRGESDRQPPAGAGAERSRLVLVLRLSPP